MCVNCHGGKVKGNLAATGGDLGAQFLPFDLTAFEYSCQPRFSKHAMQKVCKQMNEGVLLSNPKPAIRELIEGWYGGPGLPRATRDKEYVPNDWATEPGLYLDVVAPSCRVCHTASETKLLVFQGFVGELGGIQKEVFTKLSMPHALPACQRFWLSTNPYQPDVLEEAIGQLAKR